MNIKSITGTQLVNKVSTRKMCKNIEMVYVAALSSPDHQTSKHWYRDARIFANDIARIYKVTLDQVAKVIAYLSPQNGWELNKTQTELAIKTWAAENTCSGARLMASMKTRALIDRTLNEFEFPFQGGIKTTSFYRNIIGDQNYVTIDRHAISIAVGQKLSSGKQLLITLKAYKKIENAFRLVAHKKELYPYELQAITWVEWRKNPNILGV